MEAEKKEALWDAAGVEEGRFDAFREIVAALCGENGCPWDKEQTFESLKPCVIDEAAEVLAGIDIYQESGDARNLEEELGDLLMQVVLLAQLAQDEGLFTMEDVIRGISRKMVRRHPHVFGEEASASCMPEGTAQDVFYPERTTAKVDTREVLSRWELIKRAEKQCWTDEERQRQKDAVRKASCWAAEHLNQEG